MLVVAIHKNHYICTMSIKNWNEDDRPREKFLLKGRAAVSDSELLAILIGIGNKESSALDLSKELLASQENSLEKLARLSIEDLTQFKGIGLAKAVTISAALELGNRKKNQIQKSDPIVNSSKISFEILRPYLSNLRHEEFYALFLARNLKLLKTSRISIGGTDSTIVDVKIIAKQAIDQLATSVIIAHNHPSGNLKPSKHDDHITDQLKNALALFDIKLHDHLIISENEFYSYAEHDKI